MPVSQTYLKSTKFEDFDPNEPDKSEVMWAVYDGHRFRTFAQRGHAISSFYNCAQAKLYEFSGGRWQERACMHTGDRRPTVCDMCHQPTLEHQAHYDYRLKRRVVDRTRPKVNRGKYEFIRHHNKIVDPLKLVFCCSTCAAAVRNA
jgi:hypothetical protein